MRTSAWQSSVTDAGKLAVVGNGLQSLAVVGRLIQQPQSIANNRNQPPTAPQSLHPEVAVRIVNPVAVHRVDAGKDHEGPALFIHAFGEGVLAGRTRGLGR